MELIIAGFHRSGTSFTTQALHAAGLFVGDDLLGAVPSNPYGHFEDRVVIKFHEDLLQSNGATWQLERPLIPAVSPAQWGHLQNFIARRRRNHAFWGFKDPRVCHFLGLWRHVMPGAKVLVVYRHYDGCVQSLHRRHAMQLAKNEGPPQVHRRFFEEPDFGLKMWIHHNKALLRQARSAPENTMVVSFENLTEGFPLMERLVKIWDVPLEPSSVTSLFDPKATTTPDPIDVCSPQLEAEANELMDCLHNLHQS